MIPLQLLRLKCIVQAPDRILQLLFLSYSSFHINSLFRCLFVLLDLTYGSESDINSDYCYYWQKIQVRHTTVSILDTEDKNALIHSTGVVLSNMDFSLILQLLMLFPLRSFSFPYITCLCVKLSR